MRLIDADALIKELNTKGISFNVEINEVIMNQPTAYDVDKVVAELKELQDSISNHIEKLKGYKNVSLFNFTHIDVLDDAIDMVRRGGYKARIIHRIHINK